MKLHKFTKAFAAALLAAGALTACSEDVYEGVTNGTVVPSLELIDLRLSSTTVDFYYSTESSATVYIYSSQDWEATANVDWITLSPSSGTKSESGSVSYDMSVNVAQNSSTTARTGIITVSTTSGSPRLSRTVTVSQPGESPYLRLSQSYYYLTAEAQTLTVPIETNISDLAVSTSDAEACTATYDASTKEVTVIAKENLTSAMRTTYIYLTSESTNTSNSFSIRQYVAGSLEISSSEVTVPTGGGSGNITFTSQTTWTASASEGWISLSPASGSAGQASLRYTVGANDGVDSRSGQISVYCGQEVRGIVTVNQTGNTITFSTTSVTINGDGSDSPTASFSSTIAWEVSEKPEWLTVTPTSGNAGENLELTLSAEANPSVNDRSGYLTVSAQGGLSLQDRITVSQRGSAFSFEDQDIPLSWEGGDYVVSVQVPNEWQAMVSADWLSLSAYSGTGVANLTITATPNISASMRHGTVSFVSEGRTVTARVHQEGQYIIIDNTSGYIPVSGGNVEVTYTTTIGSRYELVYPEDGPTGWVTVSSQASRATEYVTWVLSAEANASSVQRTATFKIFPTMEGISENWQSGLMYYLTQLGRSLTVSTRTLTVLPDGGTSESCAITADGDYTITKPDGDNWYVINHNAAQRSFSITASAISGDEMRTSEITIALTGLPEGESVEVKVKIVQSLEGVNIAPGTDWNEDINWN